MTAADQWLQAAAYWRAQQAARAREGKWTEAGKARREADRCEELAQKAAREEAAASVGG